MAQVPVVVTSSASEISNSFDNMRPGSLNLPDPDSGPFSYACERRGSRSCLKVSSDDNGQDSGCASPARRRSVHFDASPASTVEVPAGEADKAQRGCGALFAPAAPIVSGKEVYIVPPPPEEEDEESIEKTQKLALAKAIARRQSAPVNSQHDGHRRSRMVSPPPPPIHDDNLEDIEELAKDEFVQT